MLILKSVLLMGKNVYQQILNCKTACSPVLKTKGMRKNHKTQRMKTTVA